MTSSADDLSLLDLIERELDDADAAVAAAGPGSVLLDPADTAPATPSSIAQAFREKVLGFLRALQDMFPYRADDLERWIQTFQGLTATPAGQNFAAEEWHKAMVTDSTTGEKRPVSLYVLVNEERLGEVVDAHIPLLDEIGAPYMFADPRCTDAHRHVLCVHLQKINAQARLFNLIPKAVQEKLAARALACASSTMSMDEASVQKMTMDVFKAVDMSVIAQLTGSMQAMLADASSGGVAGMVATITHAMPPGMKAMFGSEEMKAQMGLFASSATDGALREDDAEAMQQAAVDLLRGVSSGTR